MLPYGNISAFRDQKRQKCSRSGTMPVPTSDPSVRFKHPLTGQRKAHTLRFTFLHGLRSWREQSLDSKNTDFVFRSLRAHGRVPLSASVFVADRLRQRRKQECVLRTWELLRFHCKLEKFSDEVEDVKDDRPVGLAYERSTFWPRV